jgi:TolB-like protein
MGDGTLMEFGSVVDAVNFAVDVQKAMAERNADVPDERQVIYRIGINIGDIIVDGDDIYGDGVNVAARIESLADPGGILVSQAAYGQVRGKLDLTFEDAGQQTVKNIPEPIGVYRILLDGRGARKTSHGRTKGTQKVKLIGLASATALLLAAGGLAVWTHPWSTELKPAAPLPGIDVPLPHKISIAVLPFTNISRDAEQEYFVDGMTDDLITDLSRVSALFVIARNSSFTYKGKAVNVRDVSRELKVQYIVEGSVRKVGQRLRINAQLIDGMTGGHVWAERFDRNLKDVFSVQDEVVGKIVQALKAKLTESERRYLQRKSTDSLEAYEAYLRGIREFVRRSKEGNRNARELFKKAVNLDQTFARAYAYLAWSHTRDFIDGWSVKPDRSLVQARTMVQKAVSIDDTVPLTAFVNGFVELYERNHDEALSAMRKAIALDPNYSDAYAVSARILSLAGRPEAGLQPIQTAMRLNPHQPQAYFHILGTVYFGLKRYDDAAAAFKKALARNPSAQRPRMWLVATYSKLGSVENAEWEAEELLVLDPSFSVERMSKVLPFKSSSQLETLLDSLRKAGLPN